MQLSLLSGHPDLPTAHPALSLVQSSGLGCGSVHGVKSPLRRPEEAQGLPEVSAVRGATPVLSLPSPPEALPLPESGESQPVCVGFPDQPKAALLPVHPQQLCGAVFCCTQAVCSHLAVSSWGMELC